MKRSNRKVIAEETIEIVRRGYYQGPEGERVSIAPMLRHCLASTQFFPPEKLHRLRREVLARPASTTPATLEVASETTLQGICRLLSQANGAAVAALNFASAKNPGGGFLGGSEAQEESLARSSALYASLTRAPEFYERHRHESSCLYSHSLILSPGCPIFRDDEGQLLSTVRQATFLSCPAPNAGAVAKNSPDELPRIPETLRQRAELVLAAAAWHGYRFVVLGAWGCGIFRNDPEMVARTFAELLRPGGLWSCRFERVLFSVLDTSAGAETYAAFHDAVTA